MAGESVVEPTGTVFHPRGRVAVAGLGASGRAALEVLAGKGIDAIGVDDHPGTNWVKAR